MRVVLYSDEDMEPITVLELPDWAKEFFASRRIFRVPVLYDVSPMWDQTPPENFSFDTVDIWGELLRRRNGRGEELSSYMLFTSDDSLAMRLAADVLPGQRKEFHEQFERGVAHGICRILGLAGSED